MTVMKAVKSVMPAPRPHWVGDGFNVYPVFANLAFTNALSPWLMFDYAAPKRFDPTTKRLGVGQHPHRGFETVTIAFQGGVEHHDSVGNNGVIGPGDIQWMTAGRGIIHEEYHSTEFAKKGGIFEMCQLWVNLPKKDKMHAPRYQPILSEEVPVVPLAGAAAAGGEEECPAVGSVRVIAGELEGVRGPAQTFSPILLWDAVLTATGTPVELAVPDGYNRWLPTAPRSTQYGHDHRHDHRAHRLLQPHDNSPFPLLQQPLPLLAAPPASSSCGGARSVWAAPASRSASGRRGWRCSRQRARRSGCGRRRPTRPS